MGPGTSVPSDESRVQEAMDVLSRRSRLVSVLTERQLYQSELTEELDRSQSTVNRAIRSLEDLGFVERRDDGYRTTLLGRLALERHREWLREQETLLEAAEVLRTLPDEPSLPPDLILRGDATRFDSGYTLFESLVADLRDADRYRVVLPADVGVRHLRLAHSLAVEGNCDVEVLLERDRLRDVAREYYGMCSDLVESGVVRAITEPPPFAVVSTTTLRGETEEGTAQVIGYDEGGAGIGRLRSTDDDSREWARATYREYRAGSTTGRPVTDAVDPIEIPSTVGGEELPLSLRSEGFVKLDGADAEPSDPLPPPTAWRAGIGLDEVRAGYGLPRARDDDLTAEVAGNEPPTAARSLSDQLLERVRTDSPVAVLGPPGCGKSTVCKRVACAWPERTGGTVLYRESGRDDPFSSTRTLQRVLERTQRSGPVLVVVEDAVRREANGIFEVIDALGEDDDVAVLLDAREGEWTDPDEYPLDARLRAIRRELVDVVHVPRLTESDCERFLDRAEEITDGAVSVSPATILEDIHAAARHASDDGRRPIAGECFLLFQRLGRAIEPPAASTSATNRVTVVDEHVDRVRTALEDGTDTAKDVGLLANVLNAAGLSLRPAALATPVLGDDASMEAVRAALSTLEDEMLFEAPDGGGYRGIHESWSVVFLDRLQAEWDDATERLGRVLTRLLSLSDDADRRERLAERTGETAFVSGIATDPEAWVTETVEAVFELGVSHPKLAELFEQDGDHPIELPETAPDDLDVRATTVLATMCNKTGLYDRAEALYESLQTDSVQHRCERLLGLAAVDKNRGEFDRVTDHASTCLDLLGDEGDEELIARAQDLFGWALLERGQHESARERFQRSLELYRQLDDDTRRAGALSNLGNLATNRGDYEDAERYFQRALDLHERLGNRDSMATCFGNLGTVASDRAEFAAAESYYRRALDIQRDIGATRLVAINLNNLANVKTKRDDLEASERLHRRALELRREIGARHGEAVSRFNLGNVALRKGDHATAETQYERSLEIREEITDGHGSAYVLNSLAIVRVRQSEYEAAADLLERVQERFDDHGAPRHRMSCLVNRGVLKLATGDLAAARGHLERARSIGEDAEVTKKTVEVGVRLGIVDLLEESPAAAREHLQEALECSEQLGTAGWSATARGILGAVDILDGDPAAGRPACEDALETLRAESPYSTPRGTEVLWCHLAAELAAGSDARAHERCGLFDEWIRTTEGSPGYAADRIDSLRETLAPEDPA